VVTSLDIDPLVMQSYKTAMCFITSWIFLYIRGEKVTFTYMGIISAMFWVPGGVATIYAIKTAGLAIGIGVGSSFIVLVSFSWGIFFFDEHVHSRFQACSAVACMLCGLAGMAYYSAPTVAHATHNSNSTTTEDGTVIDDAYYQPMRQEDPDFLPLDDDDDDDDNSFGRSYIAMETTTTSFDENNDEDDVDDNIDDDGNSNNNNNNNAAAETLVSSSFSSSSSLIISSVVLCKGYVRIQERTLGILSALFVTGLWGGSMMVPMEFAPNIDKGLPFLTSFSIGATIVTICLWILRYIYLIYKSDYCLLQAYNTLPSFHFKKIWPYGVTCGLLWSIGNFCSILSVEYLGVGVGYSSTQSSMLISGLWGIFYFREIEGTNAIFKWFLSASVTVLGILLLSYEHHEP